MFTSGSMTVTTLFLFPALFRLNVANKDSIPGLIKPSICGQEWVFSPWDGGGKNIWCSWALDVSTCSLLTCIIFFSSRKTPKFIVHKQGRNWAKYITAQMKYIIQFWNSIIKLWCLLTYGRIFWWIYDFNWINILYEMKWKGGSLWFCCIHLWWNVQKNDREKLILLKYFKEKKTLNGGKKTVEIAEVNM